MAHTWLILAGLLLIAELLSGTFYLLMLAVAALGAWVAMMLGVDFLTQTIVFLIGAAILTVLTRRYRYRINARNRPNLAENLDAGVILTVRDWDNGIGRTYYRGTNWAVQLETDDQAPLTDGSFRIVRLDGTRIRVERL